MHPHSRSHPQTPWVGFGYETCDLEGFPNQKQVVFGVVWVCPLGVCWEFSWKFRDFAFPTNSAQLACPLKLHSKKYPWCHLQCSKEASKRSVSNQPSIILLIVSECYEFVFFVRQFFFSIFPQVANKKSTGILTWVFPKIRVPQNGWFIMENPIKNMNFCKVFSFFSGSSASRDFRAVTVFTNSWWHGFLFSHIWIKVDHIYTFIGCVLIDCLIEVFTRP